jgi:hypothetical protein
MILDFEDDGFGGDGFRRGGQRIRSDGMSAGAAQKEAGHDETRGECSAVACHVFSDAKVAAPCRDDTAMCCMDQAASRGSSSSTSVEARST